LTPTFTVPDEEIRSKVGLPSMLTSVRTVHGVLLDESPSSPPSGAPVLDGVPLLQAVRASSAAAAIPSPASVRVRRMCVSFVCCVCRVCEVCGVRERGVSA